MYNFFHSYAFKNLENRIRTSLIIKFPNQLYPSQTRISLCTRNAGYKITISITSNYRRIGKAIESNCSKFVRFLVFVFTNQTLLHALDSQVYLKRIAIPQYPIGIRILLDEISLDVISIRSISRELILPHTLIKFQRV